MVRAPYGRGVDEGVEDGVDQEEDRATSVGDGPTAASGPGVLVVAATPIGDPHDASPRLRTLLATADVLAAEDTRRLKRLCSTLGVQVRGRVVPHHEHTEAGLVEELLAAVRSGRTVLVVSDAGMPLVSDPGYRVVAAAAEAGLRVTVLPGPSAVLAALAVSGLPTDRFCFEGFLPRKEGDRSRALTALATERRTVVLFEAPHRLATMLASAERVLGGQRRAVVCRELTKTYEEVVRGTVAELAAWAATRTVLGEVTVVLAGADEPEPPEEAELVAQVRARVAGGERLKDAAGAVAQEHGVRRKALYDAAVAQPANR